MTLATGTIHRTGSGTVEFPIRGAMTLTWTKIDRENARLRVQGRMGTYECAMAWVYKRQDQDGVPVDWCWNGAAEIEGYRMFIEGRRSGDVLEVQFLDAVQPFAGPLAVVDGDGRVVA